MNAHNIKMNDTHSLLKAPNYFYFNEMYLVVWLTKFSIHLLTAPHFIHKLPLEHIHIRVELQKDLETWLVYSSWRKLLNILMSGR